MDVSQEPKAKPDSQRASNAEVGLSELTASFRLPGGGFVLAILVEDLKNHFIPWAEEKYEGPDRAIVLDLLRGEYSKSLVRVFRSEYRVNEETPKDIAILDAFEKVCAGRSQYMERRYRETGREIMSLAAEDNRRQADVFAKVKNSLQALMLEGQQTPRAGCSAPAQA